MSTPRRDWTSIGAEYVTSDERRADIEREIGGLEWHATTEGVVVTPLIPGLALKDLIDELRVPQARALAWNGALEWRDDAGEGFYPGLYGIEAQYRNGLARLYALDTGTTTLVVCADFWPNRTEETSP